MRPKNFEELLKQAKERPDLETALGRLGYTLKRVGSGRGYTEYRLTTVKGVGGDLSAVVFCKKTDGTWIVFDNKQRYGGKLSYDAIGALQTFFSHSFDEAVCALAGNSAERANFGTRKESAEERANFGTVSKEEERANFGTSFELPQRTEGKYSATFAYLCGRGISSSMISALIKTDLLYQTTVSTKSVKDMPAVVFPIYNENGEAVGADSCGTYNLEGFRYKHVYSGSDSSYGWHFANNVESVTADTPVFYCESPIDAMSLCQLKGYSGIYVSMAGCKDMTLRGMTEHYGGRPILCVDADEAGAKFRERHTELEVLIPSEGKDWNDELKAKVAKGNVQNAEITAKMQPPKR